MGLVERFRRLIRSLVRHYIQSVEDPVLLADQAIREEEEQLVIARSALASIITNRKSTISRIKSLTAEASQLQAKAERVIQTEQPNRRALAETYLLARRSCLDQVESLKRFRDAQLDKEQTFQCRLIEGEMKLREAKHRHSELLALSAENQVRSAILSIDHHLADDETRTASILARLEERVVSQAFRLDAFDELSRAALEGRMEKIQRPSIDSELDELEAKCSRSKPSTESPATDSCAGTTTNQPVLREHVGQDQLVRTSQDPIESLLD